MMNSQVFFLLALFLSMITFEIVHSAKTIEAEQKKTRFKKVSRPEDKANDLLFSILDEIKGLRADMKRHLQLQGRNDNLKFENQAIA